MGTGLCNGWKGSVSSVYGRNDSRNYGGEEVVVID